MPTAADATNLCTDCSMRGALFCASPIISCMVRWRLQCVKVASLSKRVGLMHVNIDQYAWLNLAFWRGLQQLLQQWKC